MERRQDPRYPVQWAIEFSDYLCADEATVIDVSAGGWGATSDHPPMKGAPVFLRVTVPDSEEPLEVVEAMVEWSHQGKFGMKSITMGDQERERVHRFTAKFKDLSSRTQARESIVVDRLLSSHRNAVGERAPRK